MPHLPQHELCVAGDGLLSERAAHARAVAEQAWSAFVSSRPHLGVIVWDADDWSSGLACVLAAYAAGEISSATCKLRLAACVDGGTVECHCSRVLAVRAMQAELHLWHASWQRAKGTVGAAVDFNNSFGWHALPATDPVWTSNDFLSKWMAVASAGCREGSASLPVANGPLDRTSALVAAAQRLMPPAYKLVAVTGSGTEAVLSFFHVANAYLTAMQPDDAPQVTDAKVLFFRGCYGGGSLGLQVMDG